MTVRIYKNIEDVGVTVWSGLKPPSSPFLNYHFFHALEKSHSIGAGTGWLPLYFSALDSEKKGILYCFDKNNSYGEYIFDWGWVEAYRHHGMPYFPKLNSMIPFTPATTPHFMMKVFDESLAHELLDHYEQHYRESDSSSAHFLFLRPEEVPFFQSRGYIIRESIQYHLYNDDYEGFDHFLSHFKNKKAKQIRKERIFPDDLCITSITGDELTDQHALQMYQFYTSTIALKGAIPYLKQAFFCNIFKSMKKNILYVEASQSDEPIAGALYFYDDERLYGRYWGALIDYPNLHFELCYYRGIDFCFKKNLSIFEAGAQGEHKISRGFKPIRTYSAHQFKSQVFEKAIEDYILKEKYSVSQTIEYLQERLPFRYES